MNLKKLQEYVDTSSWIVALATIILFALALFLKGFTRDLLLEAAVFLVSAKIILMSHRNGMDVKRLEQKLDKLSAQLMQQNGQKK